MGGYVTLKDVPAMQPDGITVIPPSLFLEGMIAINWDVWVLGGKKGVLNFWELLDVSYELSLIPEEMECCLDLLM